MDVETIGAVLAKVNACLNAASGLLLVRGFLAIRRKDVKAHERSMRAAFFVSAAFLASYLTRFALTGSHSYQGEGPLRVVYFAILFSHMLLAAATVPLVLRTLFLGLKERFPEHRRIAKYTFPIWAYVSATGVLVYVLLYHVGGADPAPARALGVERADLRLPLPAFALVDHHGRSFGPERLAGRVWIADFMFTSCPSVCPRLTEKLAAVEARTRAHGERLQFVSFSVDPENDTPERLTAFARAHGADSPRWTFATGSLAAIEETVIRGFKIAMGKAPDPDGSGVFSVFHGERFVLVDGEARIRGYYDADDESVARLLGDAERLLAER